MTREEAARRLREKAEDQYYVPRLRELYLMAAEALEEEPRSEGKWKFIDGEWIDYECSECGSQSTQESPYCPSCGARMEE